MPICLFVCQSATHASSKLPVISIQTVCALVCQLVDSSVCHASIRPSICLPACQSIQEPVTRSCTPVATDTSSSMAEARLPRYSQGATKCASSSFSVLTQERLDRLQVLRVAPTSPAGHQAAEQVQLAQPKALNVPGRECSGTFVIVPGSAKPKALKMFTASALEGTHEGDCTVDRSWVVDPSHAWFGQARQPAVIVGARARYTSCQGVRGGGERLPHQGIQCSLRRVVLQGSAQRLQTVVASHPTLQQLLKSISKFACNE
jgi:hypothetical protein